MNIITLGNFLVASGKITVTDPSYKPETWCQACLEVAGGNWEAQVLEEDGKVHMFQSINSNYEIPSEKSWKLTEHEIGTDSGYVGMIDHSSYLTAHSGLIESQFKTIMGPTMKINENKSFGEVSTRSAICKPGVNHNNFNLYVVKADNGVIIGLRVKFIY